MVKILCGHCGRECKLTGRVDVKYYIKSCPECMDKKKLEPVYVIYDPKNGISGRFKATGTLANVEFGASEV